MPCYLWTVSFGPCHLWIVPKRPVSFIITVLFFICHLMFAYDGFVGLFEAIILVVKLVGKSCSTGSSNALYLRRLMTKLAKLHLHPGKIQISLGIRPVWSESSLSAWRKLVSLAAHWVHSEDYDLIWVFGGRTVILLVLSCGGSFGAVSRYSFFLLTRLLYLVVSVLDYFFVVFLL